MDHVTDDLCSQWAKKTFEGGKNVIVLKYVYNKNGIKLLI